MWKCPGCGEGFQDSDKKCWSCGKERPKGALLGGALSALNKSLCSIEEKGKVSIFSLSLDSITINETKMLKEGFFKLLKNGSTKIIFDLSRTTFMPSFIVGELIIMRNKAEEAGGGLVICGVTGQVEKVFDITNLGSVLKTFKNKKEALAYFRPRSSIG